MRDDEHPPPFQVGVPPGRYSSTDPVSNKQLDYELEISIALRPRQLLRIEIESE